MSASQKRVHTILSRVLDFLYGFFFAFYNLVYFPHLLNLSHHS